MRYLEEIRRDRVNYNGVFVTPDTKAGRALIRLWLRKYPESVAPTGRAYVYVGGQNSWCGHVPLSRVSDWEPCSRTDCRTSFKCGCDGPIGYLAEEQEERYAAARREREQTRFLLRTREDEARLLRLYSVRHAFVGSRSSARAKRKTILSLGIPI